MLEAISVIEERLLLWSAFTSQLLQFRFPLAKIYRTAPDTQRGEAWNEVQAVCEKEDALWPHSICTVE
jgi:hypothetical protein